MRKQTAWRVLVALLCVLSVLPSVPAQAQEGGRTFIPLIGVQPTLTDSDSVLAASEAEVAATEAFWTREARRAATPTEMTVTAEEVAAAEAADAAADQNAQALGRPGVALGGMPAAGADEAARRDFPNEWAAAAQADAEAAEAAAPAVVDGTNGVYTTYDGNIYTQFWQYYPYRTVGVLYYRSWDGFSRWCSASVISGNNIIVTAAHCLYDTYANRWHGSFLFVPAERNLAAPYGSFSWSSARIAPGYANAATHGTGIRYDIGLISLRTNSVGRTVTSYTGWLGRSWNWDYVQSETLVAYASNWRSGYFTAINHCESFYWSTDLVACGSNLSGPGGGPYIRGFWPYAAANNWVNGVHSWSTGLGRNYHARFTSANIVYMCDLQGC